MKPKEIETFRIDLRHFERALERINKSNCLCDINIPQCHTIMDIGIAESLTVKELAEKMNLDKSTVSRQVDNLVKSGFVIRTIPEDDRRTVQITLSEQGKSVYEEMNRTLNEQIGAVLKTIPPTDLAIFLTVFKQISYSL